MACGEAGISMGCKPDWKGAWYFTAPPEKKEKRIQSIIGEIANVNREQIYLILRSQKGQNCDNLHKMRIPAQYEYAFVDDVIPIGRQ